MAISQALCSWVVLKAWTMVKYIGKPTGSITPRISPFNLSSALFTQLGSWHLNSVHLTKGQEDVMEGGELIVTAFRSQENGMVLRV